MREALPDAPPPFHHTGGHGCQYSEAMGALIVRRTAAGETLEAICRSAGMPAAETVRLWRRRNPEFDEALAEARAGVRRAVRLRERATAIVRPRGRNAAGHGAEPIYSPALAEAICARIAAGESLTGICQGAGMPTPQWVYKWLRIEPDFADAYAMAREAQAHHLFDAVGEVAARVTNKNVAASRLVFDILRWQASRLAPKKYGERLDAEGAREPITVVIRRFGEEAE